MTAEKPKPNLPTVYSLAFHRLSCSGERAPFPDAICSRINHHILGGGSRSQSLTQSEDGQEPFKTQCPGAPPYREPMVEEYSPGEVSQMLDSTLQKPHVDPWQQPLEASDFCLLPSVPAGILENCPHSPLPNPSPLLGRSCFQLKLPLLVPSLLYYVDGPNLSLARRNPSCFKGEWREWLAVVGLSLKRCILRGL